MYSFFLVLQDVKVGWTDFLPEFSPVNKSTFNVTNAVHGKVFVPVSMVEPYDETGGYDVIDKSVNEKDAHAEVCAAYERNGDTPVMNELMLADGLGPEVVGDTNMQMQVELLKRFENERAQMQQLSSLQNVLESQYSAAAQILALDDQTAHQSVGLTVLIPNSFPRRLGTIRWIGQILMLGYFAGVEVVRLAVKKLFFSFESGIIDSNLILQSLVIPNFHLRSVNIHGTVSRTSK